MHELFNEQSIHIHVHSLSYHILTVWRSQQRKWGRDDGRREEEETEATIRLCHSGDDNDGDIDCLIEHSDVCGQRKRTETES